MTTELIARTATTPHAPPRRGDVARPRRFSEDIWRIRWTDHLPVGLSSDGKNTAVILRLQK